MRRDAMALRTVKDLHDAGLVGGENADGLEHVADRYAISITPSVAELIEGNAATDALARQFVPDIRELRTHTAELSDPISDQPHSPVSGIVHRYRDRVLLKLVNICPVYCRFCFRRDMIGPGQKAMLSEQETSHALAYIDAHSEISEVIVTGGDPLVASSRRLSAVVAVINRIDHVRMIRWHTRMPVVDPGAITSSLVGALSGTSKTVRIAIHANHPRELTNQAAEACQRLREAGIKLLSQSVLLKGVNDNSDVLVQLMHRFVALGIGPYYLHHLDLAPGTNHFRVSIKRGMALVSEMKQQLAGSPSPAYILDIPGGYGKVPIVPGTVDAVGRNGRYRVVDPAGGVHIYEDIAAPEGTDETR